MESYSWISVMALLCYLFLFMAFMAAKKTRVIYSFMFLQVVMILFTGGSFLMRKAWISINFWHYVSLMGALLVPYGYFRFILDFLDEKRNHGKNMWLLFYLLCYVVNLFTGIFIPTPEVIINNTGYHFIYSYSWLIIILFIPAVIMFMQVGFLIYRYCKSNIIIFRQLRPILIGIIILLLGYIISTIPMFKGIPFDVLACPINALMAFYALYKKKLFRMTLLISRGNCYTIALIISIIGFSNII